MPVTGYAIRMIWQDANRGIGESYYWNGPSDDPVGVVYPACVNLMKARTLMMGPGVVPISFRISKTGVFRYYLNSSPNDIGTMATGPLLVNASLSAAQIAAGISAAQDGSTDQAPVAILMNAYSTPQSHSRKFLSGVPDILSRENPAGPWTVGVPSWLTLFNAYVALLTNTALKWAFRARTLPTVAPFTPVLVNAIAVNPANSLIDITLPTFGAPVGVGTSLQLRGFKMNSRAYISPNGTWQINSVTPGTVAGTSIYELRGTQSVAGSQVLYLGTAQAIDYSMFPYVNVTLGGETTHKRGNRFLASPGRRFVRAKVSS
jgi:hypothetical protein